ncbi:MAG: glycosyltransferase family 4 protein [Oligoflexales bacterium]|nr:glycosyltransferase family 4 protein [Oligoflexales bacterium]
MRIAIDARMIKPGSMHGIARYVFHLLNCLKVIGQEHDIYMLVCSISPILEMNWPDHMHSVVVRSDWISLREQWEIPKILKSLNADLFHAPSFVAPFIVPCRMIMTIHDLNHMVLPQFYTPFHQFYYQVIVRGSIKRSEYVLTVSNFSKQEIVRTLGLSIEKVFVTYNGVSDEYRPITDEKQLAYVREIYGLSSRFILCVSNNKPHKNVHQLVRAFCYSNLDIPLVLACPVDRNLIRIAENYGKKHLLYFSKFIEEEHLPAVYSMTELFVYPSTYEGFGLPPLEALSCGTPVVVARSSSLPEVVGQNAIFANPYDFKAIARALEVGINDKELRASLIEKGLTHAKRFSWETMAKQTLAIYERGYKAEVGMRMEDALL